MDKAAFDSWEELKDGTNKRDLELVEQNMHLMSDFKKGESDNSNDLDVQTIS